MHFKFLQMHVQIKDKSLVRKFQIIPYTEKKELDILRFKTVCVFF